MPVVRTAAASAAAFAFALAPAACGGAPGPLTADIAPAGTTAPSASASASASAATTAPPASASPRAAYRWVCPVGHSGGSDIIIAVKDDGATWEIATGDNLDGPFERVEKNNGTTPGREVVTGKALADPQLAHTLEVAGVKPADVASMTVYSVFLHGGWSFGLATFADKAGKNLGQAGFPMNIGNGRPCPSR